MKTHANAHKTDRTRACSYNAAEISTNLYKSVLLTCKAGKQRNMGNHWAKRWRQDAVCSDVAVVLTPDPAECHAWSRTKALEFGTQMSSGYLSVQAGSNSLKCNCLLCIIWIRVSVQFQAYLQHVIRTPGIPALISELYKCICSIAVIIIKYNKNEWQEGTGWRMPHLNYLFHLQKPPSRPSIGRYSSWEDPPFLSTSTGGSRSFSCPSNPIHMAIHDRTACLQ